MDANWKRPKVLPSKTKEYNISCGSLFAHYGYMDNEMTKLCEIPNFDIGKGGTPCKLHLSNLARDWTMLIQSPLSRKKLLRKFRKQYISTDGKDQLNCGNPFSIEGKTYKSCVELLAIEVIKQLEAK